MAAQMVDAHGLGPESLVVEVASNDGYLLRQYKRAGVPVLGIEPAVNIARVAEQDHNIPTICEFFGEELSKRLQAEGYSADVIHANNVLAHVPDLNGFVRGRRPRAPLQPAVGAPICRRSLARPARNPRPFCPKY